MNPAIWWTPSLTRGPWTSDYFNIVHGTARYDAGCEHNLLANHERGNLIRQGGSVEHIIK